MSGPHPALASTVLTAPARAFLDALHARFAGRVTALLAERAERQHRYDSGELPDFLPETRDIRETDWTVAPVPETLLDRRVEITGPAEAKMIVNALNSGARVFMADFEDSLAPTWSAVLAGHQALAEAVRGTLRVETAAKTYTLRRDRAHLFVRPRGLHLVEGHYRVEGAAMPAALFDLGLHAFHNATASAERGAGPWFYLPKLQSHREARLWADVFTHAEQALGLARGTIRATVLIETLPACFEMDEILWELRHWSAGLNCGRWDYIFSAIKTLRAHPDRVFPDRAQLRMSEGFLDAYTRRLVWTCHRRGAHAMGGMAAQVPGKSPEANSSIFATIQSDKQLEQLKGFDGTWVAHPGLVDTAAACFPTPHQLQRLPSPPPGRDALLARPGGAPTRAGLRRNADVAVRYLAHWLDGQGCVALDGLMEDAATAEICRAQLWQWQRHGARLDDGSIVTESTVAGALADAGRADHPRAPEAADLLISLATGPVLAEWLTVPAYTQLCPEVSQ
ncbi:MAG: malate synthase A [Deltaproteobacteria bacterium]|nr:malate synthase A [Deltaproteobacteria bacterium]